MVTNRNCIHVENQRNARQKRRLSSPSSPKRAHRVRLPKTNAASKPKHSPLPSFSPIDYRPQNHDANDADCPETTSILKSYVKIRTKHPSDNKGDHQNEFNDAARVHDEQNTKMEADSSSSVMSSSYEDDAVIYHDDTIDKSSQPILDSNDEQFPSSWENIVPSTKDLNVEYGRLESARRSCKFGNWMQEHTAASKRYLNK